eukprot:SAG22_NODE_16_length_32723_cov_26.404825_20_plen_93_part_00
MDGCQDCGQLTGRCVYECELLVRAANQKNLCIITGYSRQKPEIYFFPRIGRNLRRSIPLALPPFRLRGEAIIVARVRRNGARHPNSYNMTYI